MSAHKKVLICATALSLFSSISYADGVFLGSGLARVTGKETAAEYTSTNFLLMAGYEISDYIALEAETSFVLMDDTVSTQGVSLDIGASHTAFYLRASYPASEDVTIFGRLGQSNGKAEASVGNVSVSVDDTALSYGFGVELNNLFDSMAVRIDYSAAEYKDNGVTTDGSVLAVSTVYRF